MKQKLTILAVLCVCLLAHLQLMAQQLQIQGRVVDRASGDGIANATVQLVGSGIATSTDNGGNFTLRISGSNHRITVRAIGYAAQIINNVDGTKPLRIELETEIGNIDEVIVVGYGTQTRATVTGSVTTVSASDLEGMPVNRIEQSLQGRASGVMVASNSGQPGSAAAVRIRGITTLNNNEPLWVVDGVIVDNGGIGYLNQADIESINVLKDATASAIYGARAASGVILVTTKKGKSGDPRISYHGFLGTSAPAKKLKLLNATQYATLINEALKNDGKTAKFADPESYGEGTDWQSEIFNNNAFRHTHEFSVSGGTERSTYYTSFGHLNQEGIVATEISKYTRNNLRVNTTYSPARWITFGENIGYTRDKSVGLGNTNSEFGGPLSSAINLDPLTPTIVTDPNIINKSPYTHPLVVRDAHGNPYGISANVAQEMSNPLAYIQTRKGNYGWSDNIVGNAFVEIMPIEGLKWRTQMGTKLSFFGAETFTPAFYLNAASINNRTTFARGMNRSMSWILENMLSYTKSINDHNFNILVGQSASMDNNTYGLNGTYFGLPVDNFDDASMNFGVPNADRVLSGSDGVLRTTSSFFGRINYNYQEKYLLEGLLRQDGSSRFGPSNKYGTFYALSGGWVISSESFWNADNNPVSFLKLRGGYGIIGNDNITDFGYTTVIGSNRNYPFGLDGGYLIGNSPNSVSNPDLKWEETATTNFALDAVLFKKFNFSLEWFYRKTSDILLNARIPSYVGVVSNPAKNIGSTENRGIDVELGYQTTIRDWSFGVSGNASYIKNKILDLGPGVEFISGSQQNFQSSSFPIAQMRIGQPTYTFFGFKNQGIFQTQQEIDAYLNKNGQKVQPNAKPGDFKWEDTNGDGVINENDRVVLGSPIPKWTFGINLNASYKNFDLSVFGQGAAGYKIFQGLRRLDIDNANWQTRVLDRWHGEGTSTTHPRLTIADPNRNYRYPSDYYLENGSYFRLKVVQLGYTFKNFAQQINAKNLRVYVMSENLLTITKYTGYDPEIGGGANNSGMGVDRGIYPQARSFMFGINVGF